ncbi:hypothetical protein DXG01_013156 [Tephrocybe rancida]|nr:hypothetical protein DXG01_013156 [Tephrocybe rancida]
MHNGIDTYLGHKLSCAPINKEIEQILEIGAIQAAQTYPDATVTAIDISLLPPRPLPHNVMFHQLDATEPLPFEPESFDVIHARFVLIHLTYWKAVLHHLISLLKPHGWFLIEDIDVYISDDSPSGVGPRTKEFNDIYLRYMSSKHVDPFVGSSLPSTLEETEVFSEVNSVKVRCPLGDPAIGNVGRVIYTSLRRAFKDIDAKFVAAGLTPHVIEGVFGMEVADPSRNSYIMFHMTWSQKNFPSRHLACLFPNAPKKPPTSQQKVFRKNCIPTKHFRSCHGVRRDSPHVSQYERAVFSASKLDKLHNGMNVYLGHKLSWAPPIEDPKRILEIGSSFTDCLRNNLIDHLQGVAQVLGMSLILSQAIQAAQVYPGATVIAIDISPLPQRPLPQNVKFLQLSATGPLPFEPESFDIIHSRFVFGYVRRFHVLYFLKLADDFDVLPLQLTLWEQVLLRVMALLKPRGWLLIEDVVMQFYDDGSQGIGLNTKTFNDVYLRYMKARNADPLCAFSQQSTLEKTRNFSWV